MSKHFLDPSIAHPLAQTLPRQAEPTFLHVPFEQKDEAKRLGARWHPDSKRWYVPAGVDPAPFARWSRPAQPPAGFRPATIARPQANAPARAPAPPQPPLQPAPYDNPRLTIELVPETAWFSNVRDHVPPETWNQIKRRTFQAAGYRCEVCSGQGPNHPVECHEVWDYNDAQAHQTLVRCVALCPACHEVKHMGLANVRGRTAEAKAHLALVNGWDSPRVDAYVRQSFVKWKERSSKKWTLDLSWLAREFGIEVEEKRPLKSPAPGM